jgi:hypothetical protein
MEITDRGVFLLMVSITYIITFIIRN